MKSSEFKMLVMPYSDRMYRTAFRLMGNREEAEDVVREVYLKLWGMRAELPRYKSVEALSIRITRNLCLDQLRRRKVSQEAFKSEQLMEEARGVSPGEELEKKEDVALLHRLIGALPEPQRTLVQMRHLDGRDYEEIAEMVNMKVNAIRVSISRARKEMRNILDKQYATWKA